jgi:segregation and condensation protein A
MDTLTYKLEQFEGPLDLLLSLIQKNKVSITDIPIALICDQYVEYITRAQELDMELASEFIVMASELMLIKSRMLLPKTEEEADDPRATLTDALLRYQQAKEAAQKLSPMYAYYSGRMVKDTDEISIDKTFVADQDVTALCSAVRRIVAYNNALEHAATTTFKPMISKPIIPVEIKIVSIIRRIEKQGVASLFELVDSEATLPDMIASFLGVLELIKVRKLLIADSVDGEWNPENALLGASTRFIINTNEDDIEESEYLLTSDEQSEQAGDEQLSISDV